MFSHSLGNELWVLLLEKAYAKLHGGYKTLTSGHPSQALADLSGQPLLSLSFSQPKVKELVKNGQLWTLLKGFHEDGYLVAGASAGETMWKNEEEKEGLANGLAMNVLQVREAKGHKLIQLRNKWLNFEWDGDWSSQSPLWTEEMQDLLSQNPSDGTFWISLKDFVEVFESLLVCRVRNWDEVRLRGRFIRF